MQDKKIKRRGKKKVQQKFCNYLVAVSMIRQSRFNCITPSRVPVIPVARPGDPTTIERHCARLIATFRRSGSRTNPIPLGAFSASLAVRE